MLSALLPGLVLLAIFPAPVQESPRADDPDALVIGDRLLRASSLDLLGRPPYRAEREQWLGRPFLDYATDALGSEEFWRNWCEEQLYYFLLVDNFRPADSAMEPLEKGLADGKLGVQDALFRIAISSSFDRRNPGPDTFVTVVMEQCLGRTVQKGRSELEVGKHLYDGRSGVFLGVKGESQADVVRIAVQHDGFYPHLLGREHERMVRRTPTRAETRRWSKKLERSPRSFAALLREWLLSDDYKQRLDTSVTMPNRLFVRSLFVDLTDRLPEQAEARQMRNALDGLSDPGPLRSVLARLLLDSGTTDVPAREQIEDPTLWIEGLFRRLLGREPSKDELIAFLDVFHDPASRPETLVYALVSDSDYARY